MSNGRIAFRGVEKVTVNMARTIAGAQRGSEQAVESLSSRIFAISQQYVPVDTTALKASGNESGANRVTRNKVVASISYGGKSAPYAVYVHEDLGNRHKSPTSAKYLERAVIEGRAVGKPVFTKAIRQAIAKSI